MRKWGSARVVNIGAAGDSSLCKAIGSRTTYLGDSADNLRVLPAILNPRHRSLVRGNVLVFCSLICAFFLSDFPHNRATLLLLLPTLGSIVGTVETVRCIRRRWSLYHGGVILCIYMDLMVVAMILVFLLYPYAQWMTGTH